MIERRRKIKEEKDKRNSSGNRLIERRRSRITGIVQGNRLIEGRRRRITGIVQVTG